MRPMPVNLQWKDERDSGNIFANNHWYYNAYFAHCPRKNYVNSYAKPSFELLKSRNQVKRRFGEHRRTTTEAPRQKNWWNAQIECCAWFMRLRDFWAVWPRLNNFCPFRPYYTLAIMLWMLYWCAIMYSKQMQIIWRHFFYADYWSRLRFWSLAERYRLLIQ